MMADQGKGTGRYERRKTFRFLKNETLTRMGDQYQLSNTIGYDPVNPVSSGSPKLRSFTWKCK